MATCSSTINSLQSSALFRYMVRVRVREFVVHVHTAARFIRNHKSHTITYPSTLVYIHTYRVRGTYLVPGTAEMSGSSV